MTKQFKPGDVVKLRSGGPEMTVDSCEPDGYGTGKILAYCVWFEKSEPKYGNFQPALLDLISSAS